MSLLKIQYFTKNAVCPFGSFAAEMFEGHGIRK